MNCNQYAIITRENEIYFYDAADVKDAICQYASGVSRRIQNALFVKAISSLDIEEAVELFNIECWDWSDEIKQILTGYTMLYNEDNTSKDEE